MSDIADISPGNEFASPLNAIASRANARIAEAWIEDELVACTPEEHGRLLREAIRHARAEGWIPAEDPGCQCLTCRLWRKHVE